jgi:hypothetical protein
MPDVLKWDVNKDLSISIDFHANFKSHRLNNFQVPRALQIIEKYYLKIVSIELISYHGGESASLPLANSMPSRGDFRLNLNSFLNVCTVAT